VNHKLDILVAGQLILELKAVDQLAPIHTAQLMTCLKLTNRRLPTDMAWQCLTEGNGFRRYRERMFTTSICLVSCAVMTYKHRSVK
jgi:hypothetical protein